MADTIKLDKIEFKNLPSGNTPVNDENLNTVQDNVEKFGNVISTNAAKKDKELEDTLVKQEKELNDLKLKHEQIMQDYDKKEISGTSIHINDSLEYDMPISINGGIEQDTREGYNLFKPIETRITSDITFINNGDGSYNLNGTASNGIEFNVIELVENSNIEVGQTYTLLTNIAVEGVKYYLHSSNEYAWVKTQVALTTGTSANYQITEATATHYKFVIRVEAGTVLNNVTIKPMLIKGTDTTKPFEQYGSMPSLKFPSEVKGVSGHYDNVVENKNIWNGEVESGSLSNGFNLSHGECFRSKDYQKVKANTNYAFSVNGTLNRVVVSLYDKNKQFISNDGLDGLVSGNGLFTTYKNAEYMRFRSYGADGQLFANGKIQIEEGLTNTPYIEHQEQNLPIDIPTGQVWYSGKPYKENGKWYRNVDRTQDFVKNICDINEWQLNTTNGNIFYSPRTIKKAVSSKQDSDIYCTHFKHLKKYFWTDCPNNYVTQEENKTAIFFRCDSIATLEEWKEFISNEDNNVKINIITETVKEEITDTTLIKQLEALEKADSYDGVTNVNSYGNEDAAPLVLSGEYVRSNKHRIENIEKAILSLSADV